MAEWIFYNIGLFAVLLLIFWYVVRHILWPIIKVIFRIEE